MCIRDRGKVDPYLLPESLPQGLDEDHIFAVVAQIKDIYVRGSILASKLTKPEIPVGSGRFSSASGGHPGVLVHELPKLSLPCFDGQAKCWSKFTTLVDESPALTPKQKLLYLLTHLKGEAYEKVAALPIVDDLSLIHI